jgi:hypothetical protein
MNENTEPIERYLQGIVPPEHESEPHRQQLRRQILGEIERRQDMSARARIWKIAAVAAALVCTGAVAATVGVRMHRFHFDGMDKEGRYQFSTGPQTVYHGTFQDANGVQQTFSVASGRTVTLGGGDANGANVEKMQQELEEIETLRQQDIRELVSVHDMEVNGHARRLCRFRYTLADGRTRTIGEGDPEQNKPPTAVQMEQDQAEAARLRAQGIRDVVKVIDAEVEGQTTRTLICRYGLADGREITIGENDPAWPVPTRRLSSGQIEEMWRRKGLGEGQTLPPVEETCYGKTFTFERHRITLGDGTVATLSVGEVEGLKSSLTEADWKELRDLITTNAGEFLGAYELEVRGKVFTFERKRYTLSDGTEVIQADGTPKAGQ